jgi:nitroreductase
MDRRTFVKTVPALAMMAGASSAFAEELQLITLPKPEKEGGKSVLAALWERKTTREIKEDRLPPQVLSNLLWAAFGVNRETGPMALPGRTAASASNSQEIDLYVILPEGIYLYDAAAHRLVPVVAGDHRAKASGRGRRGSGAAKAPVSIVFVADLTRYAKAPFQEPGLKDPDVQKSYYYVATGLIAGNVYLFAASQGLAAWFHNCNKPELAAALKLRPEQRVLFAQTVGYPAHSFS